MYCVWGLLFPGFTVAFLLPLGFCPPKAGPVVCVSFLSGEVCAEFLFVCLFFLWWARLSEVVCCLLTTGIVLVCVVRWGVLHRVLLVDGWRGVWYWWMGGTGSWCSLVVSGLGVSAPTPKTQGWISGQERRFHKGSVMALSEIKTNIQRWTPDKWQLQNQAKNV